MRKLELLSTEALNPILLRCGYFNGYSFKKPGKMCSRTVYDYEIEYYVKSDGYVIVNGTKIPFAAGDIGIRKPGQVVQGVNPYECYMLCVDMNGQYQKRENYLLGQASQAQPQYDNSILNALPDKITLGSNQNIPALIRQLYHRQFYTDAQNILQNKIDLMLLLQSLYQLSNQVKPEIVHKKIRFAVSEIQKHYSEDFSVANLIEQSGLSKAYFHKLFKQYTGTTPNGLITQMRINQAKNLLTASREKVCDIACMCGYYDHVYFSSLFKKETGLSPSKYRRLYGEER